MKMTQNEFDKELNTLLEKVSWGLIPSYIESYLKYDPNGRELNDIGIFQDKVVELESELDSLKDDYNEIQSEYDDLESDHANLSDEFDSLKRDYNEVQSELVVQKSISTAK